VAISEEEVEEEREEEGEKGSNSEGYFSDEG